MSKTTEELERWERSLQKQSQLLNSFSKALNEKEKVLTDCEIRLESMELILIAKMRDYGIDVGLEPLTFDERKAQFTAISDLEKWLREQSS